MTVQEIYERYKIMSALQLHQLRVAAVAKIVCENSTRAYDAESIVLACLFHDMANIIKSDLDTFPDFLEPEGRAHWELVKKEFVEKYGTNVHNAALHIAKEIGLPPRAIGLIGGVGFSNLAQIRDGIDAEQQVVEYADLRVGPHGVIPLLARIEEARQRYAFAKHPDVPVHRAEEFERLRQAASDIERQLFKECDIVPDEITEQSVQPLIGDLRSLRVA